MSSTSNLQRGGQGGKKLFPRSFDLSCDLELRSTDNDDDLYIPEFEDDVSIESTTAPEEKNSPLSIESMINVEFKTNEWTREEYAALKTAVLTLLHEYHSTACGEATPRQFWTRVTLAVPGRCWSDCERRLTKILSIKLPGWLQKSSCGRCIWEDEENQILKKFMMTKSQEVSESKRYELVSQILHRRTALNCQKQWNIIRPANTRGRMVAKWTAEEIALLQKYKQENPEMKWGEIAELLPGKNAKMLQYKWKLICQKQGQDVKVRGKYFTRTETDILVKLKNIKPGWSWEKIATKLPGRTPDECRRKFERDLSKKNKGKASQNQERKLKRQKQSNDSEKSDKQVSLSNFTDSDEEC